MIVFRLSKARHAENLDGKGAEITGGRSNSKGTGMIYTSESRALCTAEIAVRTPLGNVPSDYKLVSIEIPDESIETLNKSKFPSDWKSFPHANSTQVIGDEFIRKSKSLVLKVPSAVVQDEFNYLINPIHPDFNLVKVKAIEDFSFDERLFVK